MEIVYSISKTLAGSVFFNTQVNNLIQAKNFLIFIVSFVMIFGMWAKNGPNTTCVVWHFNFGMKIKSTTGISILLKHI